MCFVLSFPPTSRRSSLQHAPHPIRYFFLTTACRISPQNPRRLLPAATKICKYKECASGMFAFSRSRSSLVSCQQIMTRSSNPVKSMIGDIPFFVILQLEITSQAVKNHGKHKGLHIHVGISPRDSHSPDPLHGKKVSPFYVTCGAHIFMLKLRDWE